MRSSAAAEDSDDDDCIILDGDPNKPVNFERGGPSTGGGGDDDDDLIVLWEKGQVACRDFPHSRHLCVSFPFSSTSHEKHCSLCYCYVCDSPAPCGLWGNGASLTDHCHATDKVEAWRIKRKHFKEKSAPISIPVARPMPAQPSNILNQVQPCSASSVASPLLSSSVRLSQHPARSQPSTARTQNVKRTKHYTGSLRLSLKQPGTQFKRARSTPIVGTPAGSGPVNSSTTHSQYKLSYDNLLIIWHLLQKPHYPEAAALSRSRQQTAISQTSQHIPVTSQRSNHMPETSQRSQHVPVTSQRSQFLPTEQVSRSVPVSSHPPPPPPPPPLIPEIRSEDSSSKWQDLVARIKSENGFSDDIIESSTTMQPYAASSRPIRDGGSAVLPSPSVASSSNAASASAHYGRPSLVLSLNPASAPVVKEEPSAPLN